MKRFLVTVICMIMFFGLIVVGWNFLLGDVKQPNAIAPQPTPSVQPSLINVPEKFLDDGIFSQYYPVAYTYMQSMTTEQKLAQLLWVRVPYEKNPSEIIKQYQFGGVVMFKKDFENLTETQVKQNIQKLQAASKTPLLVAADEEGGKIVRASLNEKLRSEPFLSPFKLYQNGGVNALVQDANDKADFLLNLGVNVVLAPVADVSQNPEDYIYNRTIGQSAGVTANYVASCVTAFNQKNIGCALKHFPGYGTNADTHTGIAVDERPLESFWQVDLRPFENGINAKAPCVLVSHNIVNAFDTVYPASLSKPVHELLRNELGFTGVITTDELDMDAIKEFANGETAVVAAFLAGNDMLMLTDYETAVPALLKAYENGKITDDMLDKSVMRILAWKAQLGLLA